MYWLVVFVFQILLMQSPSEIGQLSAVICITVSILLIITRRMSDS